MVDNSIIKRDFVEALYSRVDISKPTLEDVYEIKTYIRKWSLLVGVYADPNPDLNGIYKLVRGHSSNNIQDDDNWVQLFSSDYIDIGTRNYQTPTPPDPYSVNVGDTWTELHTGSHFRLLLYTYAGTFEDVFDDTFSKTSKRMWVETTSPGCEEEGLKTFTNSFDYTFDRDEDIYDEEFNTWDDTFDEPFGPNPRYFDVTFDLTFN